MRTKPAPVPRFKVSGLIPKLIAGRLRRARPPMATLLCIYRAPHRELTLEKVRQAEASGWDIRLWALDEVDPALARYTAGAGPGARFALLNRLAEGVDPRHWLAICDDDTRIAYPWTISTFLTVCARVGFDLAQPAHAPDSLHAHPFTEQQWGLARDTTYVETGPILAMSPRLRRRALPFPVGTQMGWYADVEWTDLVAEGYRLGIVDAVPLEHMALPGATYDQEEEHAWLDAALQERGVPRVSLIMHTVRLHRWLPLRNARSVQEA
jgi:hypothetical protein